MARCTVVWVAESAGNEGTAEERTREEARREGEGRAMENERRSGSLISGRGLEGRVVESAVGATNGGDGEQRGNAGERGERSPEAVLVHSSSLGQRRAREPGVGSERDARWGYSYNQPSRGTVAMVTTTTTTRSGLGGVFKDIFAFAASLHPVPLPLPALLSSSLGILSLSLSLRPIFVFFSSSLRFVFFILVLLFPAADDCLSSRDL